MYKRQEVVINEQANSLLNTFSKLSGIERDTVTAVSNYINRTKVWNLNQLAAFKACLHAATAARLHQPGNRMQTMHIENALIQTDWDKLLGLPSIYVSEMYDIVASRMHRYGIVCPDAALLARAGAIVERCSEIQPTNDESSALEIQTRLNLSLIHI